jgi:fructan beta-fructosidase
MYANQVPTEIWRNAMTIPRELKLKHIGSDILMVSEPVKELSGIECDPVVLKNISVAKDIAVVKKYIRGRIPCRLDISTDELSDFSVVLSNNMHEELIIGYDKTKDQFYIDRTKSGKTDFQNEFAAKHFAPRFTHSKSSTITLVIDVSSVELFADNGLTVMTEIFFPTKDYDNIDIKTPEKFSIRRLRYAQLNGIWK